MPNAATVDGDSLAYQLDIDPQSTVEPESVTSRCTCPRVQRAVPRRVVDDRRPQTLQLLTSLDDSPRYVVDASKR